MIVTAFMATACAPVPQSVPIDRIQNTHVDEPFLDGSLAQWQADGDRLVDDIRRSFRDLHWGKTYLRRQPSDDRQPLQLVRAAAILDDGRTATVVAWPVRQDQVAVALRVGQFGDAARQQNFIHMLAKTLHGKPAPKRGGSFRLP